MKPLIYYYIIRMIVILGTPFPRKTKIWQYNQYLICPHCGKEVFLTDMLGFHLDMDEDSDPDSVASAYMLIMEHLMLFTAIRLLWAHTDKSIVSEKLFIKGVS